MTDRPLSGIRVLDMSRILAGPWAGQYLADLGAEVIKVERPGPGDDARHYGPPFIARADGTSSSENFFHVSCNRGKRSLTVDISRPEGQEIIRLLAGQSDVLIENFKVGDLERYGLDFRTLHAAFPRLIYCSVTGFGQTGPYAHRPGYDAVFQGMSGLMSVTGTAEGEPGAGPMKVGPSIVDILCGLNAVIGITAALYDRDARGGTGQQVDLALYDCGVAAMSHYAQIYLTSGQVPFRRGTQGNGSVPSQMFHTADGALMLTAGNDNQFRRLCAALDAPELVNDPRFCDGPTRIANRYALSAEIQALFLKRPTADWLAALEREGVPSGPINDFQQVFDDPQIVARGMKWSVPHPHAAKIDMVGNPLHFSGTPIGPTSAPPLLGADTDDLLGSIGYDAAARRKLRVSSVI